MTSNRNYILELWRFIFCIMVLGFHFFSKIDSNLFHAGYLGVEFFFVVSGYFIGAYYTKHLAGKTLIERIKSIPTYTISRIKRLYPLYLIALVIMWFVRIITNHLNLHGALSLLKSCLAEFVMLQWTPLGNEVLISADWYIPAVFWGGLFFIILMALTGKIGGMILAPIVSFVIYRYYFILIGKIDIIVYHHCILRGMAGIGLGIFVYFVCETIKQKSTKIPQVLSYIMLVISNCALLAVFIYSQFGHRSKWDFVVIAIYAICVVCLMLANPLTLHQKVEKCFGELGKITYPVYIFQMPVIEMILFLFHLP